jgi:hypothetical protein
MKWLSDHGFIRLTKRPGLTPAIQLLDPYGSGYPLENPRSSRTWVTIPSVREHLGGYETPRYMLRDRRICRGPSGK